MSKLSNSISVAEMMHMREVEGLSNADIAKRLGASTRTIYAYIGKQPSGMRKPWGSNRKKDKLPTLSENTEVPEMPHKSCAERCEEALHKPDAEKKKVVLDEPLVLRECTHIPELIAVFGQDAVIAWLKVSLYDMGIPDCRPMNRQKMLEALKNMNAGGANT